ncbi:MAG: ribosome biogenesis GTP-binding protein YihA/YsxC [Clostridia bacterium]
MKIKSAKFLISVADYKQCPDYGMPEIAIAGKSNVGKSTFINFITNNGKLAKTSGTPGKTKLINYFEMNNKEFVLVDLPGYGFAKVNDKTKESWGKLIQGYFEHSTKLINVFFLVDIRHEPTADDMIMLNYLYFYSIPFTIIATKADKLSKVQITKRVAEIATKLATGKGNILVVSSTNKTGIEAVDERLQQVLSENNAKD